MISLGNYKSQTTSISIASYLIVSSVVSISWYVMAYVIEVAPLIAISAGVIIGAVVSLIFALLISKTLTKPMELLTQAIMHVSSENGETAAPDITSSLYGRQLLNQAIGTIYDIASGQQKLNQRLSSEHSYMGALLGTIPTPILVLDKDKKIRYHNLAANKYVGEKVDQVVGQDFSAIYNLSFLESVTLNSWLDECQKSSIKTMRTWERVKLTMQDQSNRMFDLIATFSKNDSEGLEVVLVLFDHTKLYASDESEVSFVSLAAHELRTPITALRGYIELFEDELGPGLDAEQKQFMYKMTASAAQLATFVNNILSAVKIENEQMTVHLQEENWLETIKGAAQDFALRAAVRNRKLLLKMPQQMPTVAADRVSIYEVLSNLIDNAIKYSPDGGQIIVSTYEKDGMIETTVQDFGIGIPESVIGKLFDKFYRSHRSRENVGGTGLGLYLSKAIVEGHGGNIWVRSTEGQGATFGFDLPTYTSVADKLKTTDNNGAIIRGAHGWIKNHSMYRR